MASIGRCLVGDGLSPLGGGGQGRQAGVELGRDRGPIAVVGVGGLGAEREESGAEQGNGNEATSLHGVTVSKELPRRHSHSDRAPRRPGQRIVYLNFFFVTSPALSVAITVTLCLPGEVLSPLILQLAMPDPASFALHLIFFLIGLVPCL